MHKNLCTLHSFLCIVSDVCLLSVMVCMKIEAQKRIARRSQKVQTNNSPLDLFWECP